MLVVASSCWPALVAFPVNILIFATAAAFGPWLGALYAAIGALGSALAMYLVGARYGQEALKRRLGPRLEHALAAVSASRRAGGGHAAAGARRAFYPGQSRGRGQRHQARDFMLGTRWAWRPA